MAKSKNIPYTPLENTERPTSYSNSGKFLKKLSDIEKNNSIEVNFKICKLNKLFYIYKTITGRK